MTLRLNGEIAVKMLVGAFGPCLSVCLLLSFLRRPYRGKTASYKSCGTLQR